MAKNATLPAGNKKSPLPAGCVAAAQEPALRRRRLKICAASPQRLWILRYAVGVRRKTDFF